MKTFREVYKLPFTEGGGLSSWIYDQNDNFCFQFEEWKFNAPNKLMLAIINGDDNFENPELIFTHKHGEICDNKNKHWITIRGWGNLTSQNCLGFSDIEAANIQDTLAEYIVERLNFRKPIPHQ